MKTLALLGALCLSTLPLAAQADITIYNNTNYPATASVSSSPCSSVAGDRGIIKPHGSVVIPDWAVGIYCTFDCKANLYMNRNCSGASVASAVGNVRDGVKKVDNHGINGYKVVGSGKTLSIEGGPARKWYDFILS